MCYYTCVNGNGVIRIKQDIGLVLLLLLSCMNLWAWPNEMYTRSTRKWQWRTSLVEFFYKKRSLQDLLKPIFFRFRVDSLCVFFFALLLMCNSNLLCIIIHIFSLEPVYLPMWFSPSHLRTSERYGILHQITTLDMDTGTHIHISFYFIFTWCKCAKKGLQCLHWRRKKIVIAQTIS